MAGFSLKLSVDARRRPTDLGRKPSQRLVIDNRTLSIVGRRDLPVLPERLQLFLGGFVKVRFQAERLQASAINGEYFTLFMLDSPFQI